MILTHMGTTVQTRIGIVHDNGDLEELQPIVQPLPGLNQQAAAEAISKAELKIQQIRQQMAVARAGQAAVMQQATPAAEANGERQEVKV